MFIKKIFKNQKGDTIIEVLLSMSILSLILVISYGLSNRDNQYIQQSQERSEAQSLSEQQLELLKNYLKPTTDWNGSGYKCFDNNDPPQPTSNVNNCNKGIQELDSHGNLTGRYNVTIAYDSSTHTYTVHTQWSSFTSINPETLSLSYKLPVSSLVPIGLLPECDDNIDNDGDHLVDYPADPGCTSPTDDDEVDPLPPPPPPPPPPTQFLFNGADYASCVTTEAGATSNPCRVTGNSVFGCWNYDTNYNVVDQSVSAGNYKLTIDYKDDDTCSTAPTPPSILYKFHITIYVDGNKIGGTGPHGHGPTLNLNPAGGTATIDIGAINANSTIKVVWDNNLWVPSCCTYDPDFQINTLTLDKQ